MDNLHHSMHHHHLIVPATLLGGTAVVYHRLMATHSTSQLSPLAALYMILLAVQYAVQPRLSKKYIKKNTSKVATALTEEITKSCFAAALFLCTSKDLRVTLATWTLQRSLRTAAVPAVLYAVQGVLQYQSHQHLDAVSFNGLQQTKTLSAAFFCWLLLKQSQTILQVAALLLLFGSALLFQQQPSIAVRKESADVANAKGNRIWQGVLPCLAATLISGLAGTLSQKGLQFQQNVDTNPFFYALEVSIYSSATLAAQQLIQSVSRNMLKNGKLKKTKSGAAFNHRNGYSAPKDRLLNWQMLIPVAFKAAGGILTVLVHKHTGTVSKGFALTFGLVLAACIESTTTKTHLAHHQIFGTLLVITAGRLHFAAASTH
jgi:UDP-sugar transporter A1/2/3